MVDMSKLECKDCFEEALMDIGVLEGKKIPRDKKKAFRDAYEREFYVAHDDPKGSRSKIRPF